MLLLEGQDYLLTNDTILNSLLSISLGHRLVKKVKLVYVFLLFSSHNALHGSQNIFLDYLKCSRVYTCLGFPYFD